jgi:hypothetical protein
MDLGFLDGRFASTNDVLAKEGHTSPAPSEVYCIKRFTRRSAFARNADRIRNAECDPTTTADISARTFDYRIPS